MFERFRGKERKIVAGIKFTAIVDEYIKSVISLAKRTDMSLKFTHVVEQWTSASVIYPGEYISSGIAKAAEEQRTKEATNELQKTLKPYLSKGEFETSVHVGRPGEALKSDALISRASLIVCGVKPVSYRFVPRGFSTAIELMTESSIPVLVIPEGKFYDFNGEKFTVLVCDDLSQTSADVLSTAGELSGAFRNVTLHHLHIHKESKEQLLTWANQVFEMMITRDLEYDFEIDKHSIVSNTEKAIHKKMDKRLEIPQSFLNLNNVSYTQEVRFGDVFDELTQSIKSLNPDLIVFGRHHFLHKHPVSIGKVPFYAMLNLNIPIMIVSNIGHLK
ncbi:MAG: universal stress protein [Bdellovibrionota bacterium]